MIFCLAIIGTLFQIENSIKLVGTVFSIYLLYCVEYDTNDFLLPLIYKRDHLLFANCSIHFHMNKFLVSMLLQFISCLVGNHQTTKLGVCTLVMFSAGLMRNILSLHIKFLVICTTKMPYNIWKRIGHYGHSLRPQVRRENRVRAHNWSKSLLKKYYFLYALAQTKYFVNSCSCE